MKQFYVGWTLKRGIIDPPEPLDPENNRKVNFSQRFYDDSNVPEWLRRKEHTFDERD